jgi:hypothetical protein
MMIVSMFAGLAPTRLYPRSGFNLTINGTPYDLPLPVDVGEVIATVITSTRSGFRRCDALSSESGMKAIRSDPKRLASLKNGPAYAQHDSRLEAKNEPDEHPAGYFMSRIACSQELSNRLIAAISALPDVSQHIVEHLSRRASYLLYCGGFELMRATYYFDRDEQESVLSLYRRDLPVALSEVNRGKSRLRDILRF